MNKYVKTYKQTEEIMLSRNNFLFSMIFLKLRFINTEPDIDSIIYNYNSFSNCDKFVLKRELLSKLSKGYLYKLLLLYSSNAIYNNDINFLNNVFASFIDLGLITEGSILDDKSKSLEITLSSGEKICYSPISFLSSKELRIFNGVCHESTSAFIREEENKDNEIGVVLEPILFGGQVYHSFIIVNNIIYDYSHNIAIGYDDYIRLVRPEVLVREKCSRAVNDIVDLSITDDDFKTCNYVDVLKYGIEKQLQKRNPYLKRYTRKV